MTDQFGSSDENLDLSVVIPVYGCVECLVALHDRLTETLGELGVTYEIVFIDDRSVDGSWPTLTAIADGDEQVRAVRLSRNFGQQAAITAGLSLAHGDLTVVMDCDLQNPPELIPALCAKAASGFDIVMARRSKRPDSRLRGVGARLYSRLLRVFTGADISSEFGAFSVISSRARNAVLRVPDVDRHYLAILMWIGFERASVDYEPDARYAGTSSYSWFALVRLALAGMWFQTTTLLRWVIYAGFFLATVGVIFAAYLVISYFWIHPYPGWTSLVVLVLVTSGFVTVSTGVTGLYVGTIFRQVKGRPIFLIDTEYERQTSTTTPLS